MVLFKTKPEYTFTAMNVLLEYSNINTVLCIEKLTKYSLAFENNLHVHKAEEMFILG